MSLHLLHNHSRGDSAVHRLPAALKLAAALALVLTTVLLPRTQIAALLAVAAVLILIAAASRLPAWFLLKRMLLLEPLVIGVAVLMLFQPGGVGEFAVVLLKTNLCLLATVLLSNTTPFTEMLRVLKRLRVPWTVRHHADADAPVFVRAGGRGGADAPGAGVPDVHARAAV